MSSEFPKPKEFMLDARIKQHHSALVSFIARRLPTEAEEIAQETWLRVARANPSCEDDKRFRGYVYTVARRLMIDHHRRRAVRVSLVPIEGGLNMVASRENDPCGRAAASQILDEVLAALGAMKPEVAEVFRLRTQTDLSFKDIARKQGVSLNTALGRHHHASQQIRKALIRAGLTQEGSG